MLKYWKLMLLTIQRKEPRESVTGVSTSMRKSPTTNPTIIAQRQPWAFRRFQKTPKKKTTKIGGAR